MSDDDGNELLDAVLREIAQHPRCQLLPPTGPAELPSGLAASADLSRFYQLCGGGVLFEGSDFPWRLSGPNQLTSGGVRLWGPKLAAETATDYPADLTNGCFTFVEAGSGSVDPVIVVDLHPDRLGRYYLGLWETFGIAGSMPVVAVSTSEMLGLLLQTQGEDLSMLTGRHGDAYDGVERHD